MTLVLEVAAGYLLGRFVAYHAGIVARVLWRHLILRSPWWQSAIQRDDALDRKATRMVGRT
jgi:hypothetical protein